MCLTNQQWLPWLLGGKGGYSRHLFSFFLSPVFVWLLGSLLLFLLVSLLCAGYNLEKCCFVRWWRLFPAPTCFFLFIFLRWLDLTSGVVTDDDGLPSPSTHTQKKRRPESTQQQQQHKKHGWFSLYRKQKRRPSRKTPREKEGKKYRKKRMKSTLCPAAWGV